MTSLRTGRFALGIAVIAVPLELALLGPVFAGEPGPRAASFILGDGHWLGTDFVGRNVWQQVLHGGRPVVPTALAATAPAHLVALPIGLVGALTHRRWLEELLTRPLDVLLAVPSLLLTLPATSVFSTGAVGLALLVAVVNVPTRPASYAPSPPRPPRARRSRRCAFRARPGGAWPSATSAPPCCAPWPPTPAPG
jgi:peptide/nickel transport system permease protein